MTLSRFVGLRMASDEHDAVATLADDLQISVSEAIRLAIRASLLNANPDAISALGSGVREWKARREQEHAEAMRLYAEGYRSVVIAQKLNVPYSTVARWVAMQTNGTGAY